MSLQVEKLEKGMAKLTVEVPAQEFEEALDSVWRKNRNRISIPGFRKGKASRKMIQQMYGKSFFYEDAANELIPKAYEGALRECEEQIVSSPRVNVTQIEEGQPFIFEATVALKPEVALGDYRGVQVPKASVEVTDAEVEADLSRQLENNARFNTVEGRPVADGDIAVIDYEGFVDGEAFQGGKGENYSLTIGSHSFIDNFEEQLIGKNAGESCEVHVTFPEDYQSRELAGKPAVFRVTVKEVKEKILPELDDEFASEVSDFDTLEEYRADIRQSLLREKEEQAKGAKEDAAMNAVIANAQIEIPEAMLETQQREMAEDFLQRIQMQGLSAEQYFQYAGSDMDQLTQQMRPSAERRIRSRLVLEAIAAKEGITASEEEYEAEVQRMAGNYGMEADKVRETLGEQGKKQVLEDLAVRKAADLVVDCAVEVEAPAEPEPEEPKERVEAPAEPAPEESKETSDMPEESKEIGGMPEESEEICKE